MEVTLLHSNPCGIFTDKYHTDSIATASLPCLGGKRALLFLQCSLVPPAPGLVYPASGLVLPVLGLFYPSPVLAYPALGLFPPLSG